MSKIEELRPQPDARLAFLKGFLLRPKQVGSIIPSSRFVERRLVRLAGISEARSVVEIGPGTGGTTRAILRSLPAGGRLLTIEINPRFADMLRRVPDPRLSVYCGSAERLAEALKEHGMPAPDAIVSGMPFSTMPPTVAHHVLEQIRAVLAPGGRFVAYQVRRKVADLARPVFGAPDKDREFLNVPPLYLFRWSV